MRRRIISIYLLITILISAVPSTKIYANDFDNNMTVSGNEVCEAFSAEEKLSAESVSDDDISLMEYENDDENLSLLETEDIIYAESAQQSIPSSYDGRDFGFVTSLKRQKYNYCWAFSSIAAMESNLIKKGYKDIDLSEKKMIYFRHGKLYDPLGFSSENYRVESASTDNTEMTMNGYITNGIGLVSESTTEAYSAQYVPQSIAYQREYVPLMIETTPYKQANKAKIKENIMKYGGGTVAIPFNNETVNTFSGKNNMPEAYVYTTGCGSITHLVELIGWDDSFAAANFTPSATCDGAWLTKDPNGYFAWIPYCDMDNAELSNRNATFYDMSPNFYDNNYHYGNGGDSAIIKSASSPGTVSYLTAFTSKAVSSETIKAIVAGFENTESAIGKCTITLYRNPIMESGLVSSYEEAKAYSYEPAFSGIHTIIFPQPFVVNSGDTFAVRMDVPHTTGVYHELYEDINQKGFQYHLDAAKRKNYYKSAESGCFTDHADIQGKRNTVLAIKILTDGATTNEQQPEPTDSSKVKAEKPYDEVAPVEEKSEPVKENVTFTKDGLTYQIKKDFDLNADDQVVATYYAVLKDGKKNKKSKVVIPDKVKINGNSYKVLAISKNAFCGNKKIKTLVLGKNVTTIGKNAFKGCKKLKKVQIKSGKINKVASSAFKKTAKNLKIKYPKKYKNKYKKLFF